MGRKLTLSSDQEGRPGPRGLVIRVSGTDERFGAIYYGVSPDREAAAAWGDDLPFAIIPEHAKDLAWDRAQLPVAVEVDGQRGLIDQPHVGFLKVRFLWSREHRAIHVQFPDRRYRYLRRRLHIRCEREGVGEVLRWGVGNYRITDRADAFDAVVGLLIARVIGDSYISLIGQVGPTDAAFVRTK